MTRLDAVVVIPVHNEELLLPECLMSVERAAQDVRRAGSHVRIIVVLDACTDRSASVAACFDVETLRTGFNSVGAARREGIARALRGSSPRRRPHLWLANTDADSQVPPNWLDHQLIQARLGADLIVGTVQPDFADLTPQHVGLWHRTHTPGAPNGHVHGANLGIRASTYVSAGGFSEISEHEDVVLVDRVRAIGATIVASDEAQVITSGRFTGRTPGGYARYLREQSAALPEPEPA